MSTMTQSDPETTEAPDKPISGVDEVNAAPDDILRMLVRIVNRLVGVEFGVSLHCNGMVVCGLLISGHTFLSELAAEIRGPAGGSGEVRDALAEGLEHLAGRYPSKPPDDDEHDEQQEPNRTGYIHLRNAELYVPGATRPIPIGLWRGRLSAVAGWNLGTLEAQ